ncbi:MAG: DUF3800 domain-containing protein [Nitrospira sp.]|nr:DUF3800 domain-containing protein [Nitrospira sp.]MDE0404921.1 DUF3800 domain-containing protein [Nitrospira sp.]MDE0506807.1 DUF3800 domain-containing protein [Candidatus Poribacteria bacterium]
MQKTKTPRPRNLYMFVDEGGNFDFSEKGTAFFTLTCVTTERPFGMYQEIDNYKYDLIEHDFPLESFHCAEDNRHIRSKMFGFIKKYLAKLRIDSLIVEKRKTSPSLQKPTEFYPSMLGYLLAYVLKDYRSGQFSKIVIITDSIPEASKRKAMEKATKTMLATMLPKGTNYIILHHAAKSHYCLQIVDYCNWSIFRKWERSDNEHYSLIKSAIRSEVDIFLTGKRRYY